MNFLNENYFYRHQPISFNILNKSHNLTLLLHEFFFFIFLFARIFVSWHLPLHEFFFGFFPSPPITFLMVRPLEYGTVYVPIHNMPTRTYVMYGGHILYRIYLPAIFLKIQPSKARFFSLIPDLVRDSFIWPLVGPNTAGLRLRKLSYASSLEPSYLGNSWLPRNSNKYANWPSLQAVNYLPIVQIANCLMPSQEFSIFYCAEKRTIWSIFDNFCHHSHALSKQNQ